MVFTIIVSLAAIFLMMVCILFKPTIQIGKLKLDTFFMPPLLAAIILLIYPNFDKDGLWNVLFTNSRLNPLKILVLFISVSFISISLDEAGFFKYLANKFITKFNANQFYLFFALYFLISILTIFTSNDIVILTFTPFILYFAKHGNISPIPYLVMEFVAANTYSIFLPIGNPTNIYLTSIFEIDFLSYVKTLCIPTIIIGLTTLTTMFLLFYNKLKEPIAVYSSSVIKINNKVLCSFSFVDLGLTTILLAISNYLDFEMWIITVTAATILLIVLTIYSVIKKNKDYLVKPIKRIPYNLIPFVLSMFVIIMGLDYFGLFTHISNLIENINNTKLKEIIYLITSTLSCNVVNNIPMTIAYGSILAHTTNMNYIYMSVIGSNLGALLTPVGALAGIMWVRMLKENDIKYNFLTFMKNGAIILSPTILMTILYLFII